MPAGWGEDEQRFAAAVETVDLTGLPLNAALRRDLQVASMLRDTGAALSPDAAASARMKARLFAAIEGQNMTREPARFDTASVAPAAAVVPAEADLAAEVTEVQPVTVEQLTERIGSAGTGRGRHRTEGRRSRSAASPASTAAGDATPLLRARARRDSARESARRFPIVGAAATLMLVAVASAAVFLSRDALPGDSLYGVKRAAESVGMGLTFDSVEKANRHLDLADTRMQEVAALSSRQSPDTPARVDQGLQAFNTETAAASRLMLGDAQSVDATQLSTLREWTAERKASLSSLRKGMPAPSRAGADDSMALLNRVQNRADALNTRLPCRELSAGMSDDLGILPADGKCTPLPAGVDPSQARLPGEPAGLDPSKLGLTGPKSAAPGGNGTSSDPSSSAGPSDVQVPAPVGRVTIPPLLPGLPDIIIGG
jgi:hypothetical protein